MAKMLDRNSAVEEIKSLNEDELLFLNQLIIERLKLISQAKSTFLMADFRIGERGLFPGGGKPAKARHYSTTEQENNNHQNR